MTLVAYEDKIGGIAGTAQVSGRTADAYTLEITE